MRAVTPSEFRRLTSDLPNVTAVEYMSAVNHVKPNRAVAAGFHQDFIRLRPSRSAAFEILIALGTYRSVGVQGATGALDNALAVAGGARPSRLSRAPRSEHLVDDVPLHDHYTTVTCAPRSEHLVDDGGGSVGGSGHESRHGALIGMEGVDVGGDREQKRDHLEGRRGNRCMNVTLTLQDRRENIWRDGGVSGGEGGRVRGGEGRGGGYTQCHPRLLLARPHVTVV